MPWCDDCAKFYNPNSMPPDGTCPSCGAVIGDPPDTSVPWHFWVLIGATVLYLGWRLVQGIQWLAGNGFTWAAVLVVLLCVVVAGMAVVAWRLRDEVDEDLDDGVADGAEGAG